MTSIIILKNVSGGDLAFSGIFIPSGGNNEGTRDRERLAQDTDLAAAITAGDIVINDGTNDLSAARALRYLDGAPPILSRHSGAVEQAFSQDWSTLLFDTDVQTDEDFYFYHTIAAGPLLGGSIDFLQSGIYKIEYAATLTNTTNNRANSNIRVVINDVAVAGSEGYGYHRAQSTGINTVAVSLSVTIAANDVLRVQARAVEPRNLLTVPNASQINITRISD